MLLRLAVLCASGHAVVAHMSPWLPSMYGAPTYGIENQVAPLGPGLDLDSWWFRGPVVRDAPPGDGEVAELPAGGNFTLEIACDIALTTDGGGDPDSTMACDAPGPYHADPDAETVNYDLLAGCALGIADVTDINEATLDNFVIFSVQQECVWQRNTTFQVPARMPPCTGDWCICGWVWEPQTGSGNMYHTAFRCKVTGSPEDATAIASPNDPVYCPDSKEDCTKGAKRMIVTFNEPVNVPFTSNEDRPGYHDTFGFFDGPQDDIFLAATATAESAAAIITVVSSSLRAVAASTASSSSTFSSSPSLASISRAPSSSPSSSTTRSSSQSAAPTSSERPLASTSSASSSGFAVVRASSSSSSSRSTTIPQSSTSITPSSVSKTTTTSAPLVWLPVSTRPSSTSRTPSRVAATTSLDSLAWLPVVTSRTSTSLALEAAASITTTTTSSTSRPTRKTYRDRTSSVAHAVETALARRAAHERRAGRARGGGGFGGTAEAVVEKMMKMVRAKRTVERAAVLDEGEAELAAAAKETLVWTRVEL
ncbi:hypothetical protein JCM1840_004729 [Sporobolomyces johnsonii]